jgi:hypothetical protein
VRIRSNKQKNRRSTTHKSLTTRKEARKSVSGHRRGEKEKLKKRRKPRKSKLTNQIDNLRTFAPG